MFIVTIVRLHSMGKDLLKKALVNAGHYGSTGNSDDPSQMEEGRRTAAVPAEAGQVSRSKSSFHANNVGDNSCFGRCVTMPKPLAVFICFSVSTILVAAEIHTPCKH